MAHRNFQGKSNTESDRAITESSILSRRRIYLSTSSRSVTDEKFIVPDHTIEASACSKVQTVALSTMEELSSAVAGLGMEGIDEGEHIFEGDITFHGVGRGEDIPAVGAGL